MLELEHFHIPSEYVKKVLSWKKVQNVFELVLTLSLYLNKSFKKSLIFMLHSLSKIFP